MAAHGLIKQASPESSNVAWTSSDGKQFHTKRHKTWYRAQNVKQKLEVRNSTMKEDPPEPGMNPTIKAAGTETTHTHNTAKRTAGEATNRVQQPQSEH